MPEQKVQPEDGPVKGAHPMNWLKISVITNIVIVALVTIWLGGSAVVHQSDTNPKFCATCHLMSSHVDSYLNGNTMDSIHATAGVQCKDCHDYALDAEILSGINYLFGNYEVQSAEKPELVRRKYDDEMCLKCHISVDYLADQTDFLSKNPHRSHWPDITCGTCHISHGEQIDYCSECHDNGGQRMTGDEIVPREINPWESGGETSDQTLSTSSQT